MDDGLHSSLEAARAANITYRQLDYWARTHVLEPTIAARGSGSQRSYSTDDVVALALIGTISETVNGNDPLPFDARAVVASHAELVALVPRTFARPQFVQIHDLEHLAALFSEHDSVRIVALGQIRRRVESALHARTPVRA